MAYLFMDNVGYNQYFEVLEKAKNTISNNVTIRINDTYKYMGLELKL